MSNITLLQAACRERARTLMLADEAQDAHGDFPHFAAPPPNEIARDARDLRLVLAWIAAAIVVAFALLGAAAAFARDDGRWANSPLKAWFDSLASGKGLCCSFADGVSIKDVDWGTEAVAGADGKTAIVYWVMIDGKTIAVPPDAVVTVPNKFGAAVVWPYQDADGKTQIRCFLPGAGS